MANRHTIAFWACLVLANVTHYWYINLAYIVLALVNGYLDVRFSQKYGN